MKQDIKSILLPLIEGVPVGRGRFSLLAAGAIAASIITPTATAAPAVTPEKMNVLFLIVDDLRPELNCYGARYMKTPNIDALAASGVMFENAYCNVPVSGASRASLFSGLRPGKTRYWDVNAEIDIEAPGIVTLPQLFKENGYVTISNSKVIHGKNDAAKRSWSKSWMPEGRSATWRDYLGDENLATEKQRGGPTAYECLDVEDNAYFDGKTVEKTIADLRNLKQSGQPFFLATGILKPHLPFNAPKKYWDMYDARNIDVPETFDFDRTAAGLPDAAFHAYNEIRYYKGVPAKADISREEARRLIHGYRACVSYADTQVGRILDELKRLKLDKNTIVVLLGDHGWSLGDHNQWCKHSNFNIVNNAPLIVRIPGQTDESSKKRTTVESRMVEFVDVYPTLCDASGLSIPAHAEGESLVPLMKGNAQNWKDCAIIKWHSGTTYFDRDYGYTEWRDKQEQLTAQMLFLYRNDHKETVNVASLPEHAALIARLQGEIKARRGKDFLKETTAMPAADKGKAKGKCKGQVQGQKNSDIKNKNL